ncbi:MAG: histidine phosphatase family protein [Dongiaceae bacterium]
MTEALVTRWWWIRHAPVTAHGGRIYGQTDLPADCSDAACFAALARQLPPEAVWVTTQLCRTHQTAAAIHRAAGRECPAFVSEPGLAEQHFGDWQGLTHAELADRRDGHWHRFWLAPAEMAPPGGESFAAVVDRVGLAVERLTRAHAGADIVAVAHGGSIRAALAAALGLAPERALGFAIDNCSLTRIDHIEGASSSAEPGASRSWRVVRVNHHPTGSFADLPGPVSPVVSVSSR